MKVKYVILGLILSALAIMSFLWLERPNQAAGQSGAQEAPVIEVSVMTIAPRPVTFTKDLPGRTSAFRVAEIRPQVSGIIIKRLFEEGGDVTAGQQLYQIDPAPYQTAYDRAQANLLKAEVNVDSLTTKAARYAVLLKTGSVGIQDHDDVIAALQQGKADIAIAKAEVATAKINLDYTKVFSPIAGRIGQSLVTEGALVTADQAFPLATVQQFDKIYVDVSQSGEELMRLRDQYEDTAVGTGQGAAQLLIGGEVYSGNGSLQFSDVSVNRTTGTVQLRILFPNPDHRILPGLFVHARLPQTKDDAAILVPQRSIARSADGKVTVWVVDAENKAELRQVTISDIVGDQWRSTAGLRAGERLVVEGVMKIHSGAVVHPVEIER
jgi:membrane fusion protein (multidrug efflux system)